MKCLRFAAFNVFPFFMLLVSNPASATASVQGLVSAIFTERAGSCNNFVKQDPIRQDFLDLSLSAPCSNGTVGGSIEADASAASVGLRLTSSGTGLGYASVYLADDVILTPPRGTTVGTFTIPVTFQLKGEIDKRTKMQEDPFFLAYGFAGRGTFFFGDSYVENGFVEDTGKFELTTGFELKSSSYWGTQNQISAYYRIELRVPGMLEGNIDFFDTAFASFSLPEGWTGKTSSGLTLTSPIPEPSSALMFALGVGFLARRRLARLAHLRSRE